jgi:hypothetical protein
MCLATPVAERDAAATVRCWGVIVPSLRNVERQIERVEGFRVAFRHPDGRDVRGDMQDVLSYSFKHRLPDERTVSEWIRIRFHERYRGFDVAVLLPDGSRAHGNTRLGTARRAWES